GVKIIINDRVDVALAVAADGVHLGQDDLPPAEARSILGENAIIGFSTHTIEQAIRAMNLPIDYIAIGPVFTTDTKLDPDAVIGLEGLREVRNAIGDFPLVAIGGINDTNQLSVFAAGADSAAMISALVADATVIEQRMKFFLTQMPQ
ncbi:MAG TPA: thiamine phosphate synthase, partial [Pyrinomonadaceae bacterium]|nr:thiamine phosphate synthase [Pyrinomonadaceae bacterium]